MAAMIWLNGELRSDDAAKVSIFDRGFLYGDGLFETIPVYCGVPFLIDAHLRRLQDSAAAMRFVGAPSPQDWKRAVAALLAAEQTDCATLRLWMSRGINTATGLSCTAATSPTWIAACLPARKHAGRLYAEGASLYAVDRMHVLPSQLPTASKHSNYLASILAFDDVHAAGADEALLCIPDGHVCEGAYSNLFFIFDGVVCTPPLSDGPLAGIARACIVDLACGLGMQVEERAIPYASLAAAGEAFITNSLIGIAPVARILNFNSAPLDFQTPGPMTQQLSAAYAELVQAQTGFHWPLIA